MILSRCTRTVVLALVVLLLVPALYAADGRDAACTPTFPVGQQQWLGGDAVYSVPLPDGRTVWIFGDTLYGDKRVVVGKDPVMTHNSMAISTCKDGKWNIDYFFKRGADGKFIDFFPARLKGTLAWPLGATRVGTDLLVTMICIRPLPNSANEAMGFETCGADLARVSNLGPDPQKWNIQVIPWIADGVKAYPSTAALVEGKYVYIFGLYETGKRPLVVTRIPVTGLADPLKNTQYLAKNGKWKRGFNPADAKEVMERGSSEMSIAYHPDRKQWVAVLNEPGWFSDKVIFRTAPSMFGPWTEGEVIYRIPDMQKDYPHYDEHTFCYAAKEQPQFRKEDSILFTYACNTQKVEKLVTIPDLYIPKAVRVTPPAK